MYAATQGMPMAGSPIELVVSPDQGGSPPSHAEPFNDLPFIQSNVTGAHIVELRIWAGEFVHGLQVVYSLNGQLIEGARHVGRAVHHHPAKSFRLQPGETIVRLTGHCGDWIDHLIFTTSFGRSERFGTSQGGHPFSFDTPMGGHIIGFKGIYSNDMRSTLIQIGCVFVKPVMIQQQQQQPAYTAPSHYDHHGHHGGAGGVHGGGGLPPEFSLHARESNGMVMDVEGNNHKEMAHVIIYTRSGQANQRFRYEPIDGEWGYIVACHSGMVLDIMGANQSDGAEVIQYKRTGALNQLWNISPQRVGEPVTIRSKLNGKVIERHNLDQWSPVHMASHHDHQRQQWIIQG